MKASVVIAIFALSWAIDGADARGVRNKHGEEHVALTAGTAGKAQVQGNSSEGQQHAARVPLAEHGESAAAVVQQGEGRERLGAAIRIVPPLTDVASHKKFFGPPFPADYPEDHQPMAPKDLFEKGQPYPKVQEQGFFDKDYVKDENGDGGEWQAQMDYDTARAKIGTAAERKKVAEKKSEAGSRVAADAKKKYEAKKEEEDRAAEAEVKAEKKAKDEKDRAKGEEEKAKKEAEEQKAREEAAKEVARKAEEAKQDAETAKETVERQLKEARDALDKEREDFKGCQRELDEAKAKMESLQKEMEELMKSHTDESALLFRRKREVEEQQHLIREEEEKTARAQAKRDEALAKLTAVRNETKTAQRELEEERSEYEAAQHKAKKEEKDLAEAEQELGTARTQLRKARGQEALPVNEERPTPPKAQKSAAAVPAESRMAVFIGALLAWMTCMSMGK